MWDRPSLNTNQASAGILDSHGATLNQPNRQAAGRPQTQLETPTVTPTVPEESDRPGIVDEKFIDLTQLDDGVEQMGSPHSGQQPHVGGLPHVLPSNPALGGATTAFAPAVRTTNLPSGPWSNIVQRSLMPRPTPSERLGGPSSGERSTNQSA